MSNKPNLKARRTSAVPTTEQPWWQSPMAWVGGLLLIAVIAAITISVAGGTDDPAGPAGETAFAEIIGSPLPAFAVPDPAIGMTAPILSAATLGGDRVRLAPDGTARILGFFAHWCPHCQAELPIITNWLETNPLPAGVEVIAVSTAVDSDADNYPPSEWFPRENWPNTVLLDDDDNALAVGLGLPGYPYWVAIDADGTVVDRISGSVSEADLAALVNRLIPADTGSAASDGTEATGVRLVTPAEGLAIASNPPDDLVVLDVRTPEEFAAGHLEGATLVDFYDPDFADQLADLDPDVPYLLYCQSGNRSGQSAVLMEQLGFTDVADVDGGILAWTEVGNPVES